MNLPNGYLLQKGKYKLTQAIGQGGFGITYKGVWYTEVKGALGAMRTEVPVCIKEYFFKDYCLRDPQSLAVKVHSDTGKMLFDKFKEKLIKEAKILSEVHHPYIVNVLEVFEENNTAYIAMEYIPGDSLKDKLAHEGMLPEPQVLRYIYQIGEALKFVHKKNILHLDIKPSNILIDKEGNARLIDFGVSKRYDVGEQETSTTMLTLSKGFASIEQYDNEGIQSFSPCPDVYSLGATMYNLLTGKIPTESILRATRSLVHPRELNPAISPRTEEVILKAMEIIPANRYQSIAEMMGALDFSSCEKIENKVRKPEVKVGENEKDETTLLYNTEDSGREEDETIVDTTGTNLEKQSPADEKPKESKKKRNHKLIVYYLVALLVLGGVVAAVWERKEKKQPSGPLPVAVVKPQQPEEKQPAVVPHEKIDSVESDNISAGNEKLVGKDSGKQAEGISNSPIEKTKEVLAKKAGTPAAVPAKGEKPETKLKTVEKVSDDATYQQLLASAKEKMAQKDFAGASKELSKAKSLKITEDVVRLQIDCNQQWEKQRIEERKLQYVEMMQFGSFTVVRKKTTGRYGVIDANAKEVIPCKYLSVGKAENGRAFQRDDNLYDIYGSDGELITRGATYY